MPPALSKTPKYGAILFAGVIGWNFGSTFVFSQMGDSEQYNYLISNRSAILKGEKSLN